ncbi:hypothetical protein [Sphingobacterium suaedae]|uniref:DUF4840 domain-containing protein n=1 Tax=Sphingobacterium suaedae TaxID=1686402 RepID=A0ABW5KCR6_9SPHI
MKTTLFPAVIFIGLGGILCGCGNNSKTEDKSQQAKQLTQNIGQYIVNSDTENPSVYLSLVDSKETDSSMVYVAKSLRNRDTIGLQIEVVKNIPAGLYPDGNPNNEKGFTSGAIKFSSIGSESDNFIQALGGLYKHSVKGGMTEVTLLPLVFSSNKKNIDLKKNGTYTFKLFFNNSAGAEAEVFAVLDLYKRLFEFRAKDSTQYERILAAFQGL